MEYLNGGDLYSMLRNLGCLDEDMARVYIAEVVSILAFVVCWFNFFCFVYRNVFIFCCSTGSCVGVFAFAKYSSQRLKAR